MYFFYENLIINVDNITHIRPNFKADGQYYVYFVGGKFVPVGQVCYDKLIQFVKDIKTY